MKGEKMNQIITKEHPTYQAESAEYQVNQESLKIESKQILELIQKHQQDKDKISSICDTLVDLNISDYDVADCIWNKGFYKANKKEEVLQKLSSKYWRELFTIIDLKQFLSVKDSDDIYTRIANKEMMGFSYENVENLIKHIWNNRHQNYARKIESLFANLDRNFKSNMAAGINPYIIIGSYGGYDNSYRINNLVDEVRLICRQIFSKPIDKENFKKIEKHRELHTWINIDHNLLRIKFYENGNCHILFNKIVIDRINEILNLLYPNQVGININGHKRKAFIGKILD